MPETLAAVPEPGGYVSLGKVIVMLLFVLPWLAAAPWVNKDAKRLRLGQTGWSLVALGGGTVGLLVWLLVPHFLVGLIIYAILTTGCLVMYVVVRNGRVPDDAKVLTGDHLAGLFDKSRRVAPETEILSLVKVYGASGRIVLPPEPESASPDDLHAYNQAQALLNEIVWRRASEADLSPAGRGTRLLLVIDGVGVERPGPAPEDAEAALQFLKEQAGLSVEERRKPQQGRLAVDREGRHVDLVLTTAGSTTGQRAQFRIEQEAVRTRLDELGMSDGMLDRVRELLNRPNGLIIASGRPKNGVTSTLYSMLREHDAFMQLLVTLEREPEVDLENITQNKYDDPSKQATALSSVLRRDPNVILIDECSNPKTAEVITEGAREKQFLLGMRAADTFTALAKWLKVAGDARAALADLHAVLCQVLLRKLCEACREPYRPDPSVLAKANLQGQKADRFYRPPKEPARDEKGNPIVCSACQGSGYVGRTAAFELLELNDELRQLIVSGATISQLKAACRKGGMLYLQEIALQKVMRGETSVQEVIRVSKDAKKK
jgi:type II secretory ATPase GspE/PulE/Tfp pilus assembly ATPase PilB-like protein